MAELFEFPKSDAACDVTDVTRPPDWLERQQALDIRQSWIVEAPAGSGKTGLLIQRYLKLLADESVESPEQVIAITYTVKATAEMRERVLAQLEGASRGTPLKSGSEFDCETRELALAVFRRDELLGWGLLEHPRRLNIRTIDSVCGEIARLLPVLSGSGGRLSPVADATLMYREAARQTLMQLGGEDAALSAALRTILLHRDGSLGDCQRLLVEMLPLRNQWGELVPLGERELDDAFLDGAVLPRLESTLEQAVRAGLSELHRSVPAGILDQLSRLAGEMGHAEGYRGAPSPIAMLAGVHSAPGETAEDLEHWQALIHLLTKADGEWREGFRSGWLKFEMEKSHTERLSGLVDELRDRDDVLRAIKRVNSLPPRKYPPEQWEVAKALFRVLRHALAELQLVFARAGECDFAELGLLAKTALQQEGAVDALGSALGMRLQHLLVDEMQDTSSSQYALIEQLAQGWDGHSQTVFLVGDPKQSIYLFRQARVERFVRTMMTEHLGDLPVGCLRLTANFRSQRALVDEFNEDFSLLFPRVVSEINPEEVPYVAAEAVLGPTRNGGRGTVWHTHVLPSGLPATEAKKERRRRAKVDAQAVRGIVKGWRVRPLPEGRSEPWKIAVLVRSRPHLIDIVASLKEDDGDGPIPFRAVDIEALGERPEVLDLSALTRALMHPADRVAWLAVLHAPWCGLGLADLHMLAGADDPDWSERCIEDVVAKRGELLSEESCARLARIWPVLQAAGEQRGRLKTSEWVERTWRSLGGDAYLKPEEMANARRYLQLLDEVEKQVGRMDLALLKLRLDELYAEPSLSADAVDLMTIHKAKGLEWDVVIVPGLEKRPPPNRSKLLAWNEIDSEDEQSAQVVLAPIIGKGEDSRELNDWLKGIDKAREAAERKRLFYVACTRAREELHLFAAPERKRNGEIKRAPGSLLDAAWPAAQSHFVEDASVETAARVLTFPSTEEVENEYVGDIAAEAGEEPRPAALRRLPLGFMPQMRFVTEQKLSYGEAEVAPAAAYFERPEGSFEARAFGNAVHTFLELLARRLSDGVPADALSLEIAGWTARIAAVLRTDGLPPATVRTLTAKVRSALIATLQDETGLWVLSAREASSSEFALTSWGDRRNSVRMDRVFRAGSKPLSAGSNCLWIVDYKTTTHGREGVETFLEREREKYTTQMEAYTRMMRRMTASTDVRVGLYYPMLPRLIWWTPEMA